MKRSLLISTSLALILFVAFVWWRADQGHLPAAISALYNFPHGDKVGHFLLMGVLTFFVCLPFSFGGWQAVKKRIFMVLLLIAVIITLEEISQHFFSTRSMDIVDLICSYAGILVFSGIVLLFQRKQRHSETR